MRPAVLAADPPAELTLKASLSLDLAAGRGKQPRVSILAYGGGIMTVSGWGPIVIDLAGMELPGRRVNLLADHDNRTASIVGAADVAVRDHQLHAEGTLVEATQAGGEIATLARAGIEFEASIGAEVRASSPVKRGESVQVNGRTITADAGFTLVSKSRLREISLVAVGADPSTNVKIAAKEPKMGDESGTVTGQVADNEAVAAERARVAGIQDMCAGGFPELEREAIRAGWSVEETAKRALKAHRDEAPRLGPEVTVLHPVRGTAGLNLDGRAALLAAGALMHAGLDKVAEEAFGKVTAQRAFEMGATSLADLCKAALYMEGRTIPRGRDEMIRAAFSTESLPTALGLSANKALLAAYVQTRRTFESFSAIRPARDFKVHSDIRPSMVGSIEQVAASGELKYDQLSEDVIERSIDTFGKVVGITRKSILNDDLGFLQQTPNLMGGMASRGLSDLVWTVIMANGGSFFSSGNGNILTGATSALSLDSLTAAVTLMRKQTDQHGHDIDIAPAVLAVPPELEMTARNILNSAWIMAAEGAPGGNALQGIATLEVESRLSNADAFENASAKAWFLFAAPVNVPVIVSFLDGRTAPTLEQVNMAPDALGVAFRVYFDYGAVLGDSVAAVRSDGE